MNVSQSKTRIALAVLALGASAAVSAAPMVLTGVSGPVIKWDEVSQGQLAQNPNATVSSLLAGDASAPGGNVELNKYGGTGYLPGFTGVSSLTGTVNGKPISLSSLERGDWTADNNALAYRYVSGAAQSINYSWTSPTELDLAVARFLTGSVNGSSLQPWQFVSDPNISYVNIDGHTVSIGLAGFLDAAPILNALFGTQQNPSPAPAGSQASEVVKVALGGGAPEYLFGFIATPSGVTTRDGSYTGNYQVEIPEPESLALFGLGLVGLFLGRRRQS